MYENNSNAILTKKSGEKSRRKRKSPVQHTSPQFNHQKQIFRKEGENSLPTQPDLRKNQQQKKKTSLPPTRPSEITVQRGT